MSAITDDEVVERVVRAIYDDDGNGIPWESASADVQEAYLDTARVAIRAHRDSYQTPYVDERHQGGNLLEFFIQVSGRLHRAEEELGAIKQFAEANDGGQADPDVTTLTAVQNMAWSLGGWKVLVDVYARERDEAREELAEARDAARINDFSILQAQYTKVAADLAIERQKNLDLNVELSRRQRQGQVAMNVLGIVRSDLYSSASGTGIDPFHQDQRLAKFFDWLRTVITLEERVARDRGVRHELKDVAEELGVDLEEPFHGRRSEDDPLRPATFQETLGVLREFSDAMADADEPDDLDVAEGIRIINRHLNFAHGSGNALASLEAIREKVGLCKGGKGIWARYCEGDCSDG